MATIVSVHSFRGGTGKSNVAANLAALAAQAGQRVGIVDTDISSPGVHVLFGLDSEAAPATLNDYLWGRCAIGDAAHEIAVDGGDPTVVLIPARLDTGAITRVLREGYDVGLLVDGFRELVQAASLDLLFIDTHPGLNDETLLSITISDVLLLVMRPDEQDYLGTAVTVEVARRLDVPHLRLLINKVPRGYGPETVAAQVSETYGVPVAGVLPHSERMLELGSRGLFVREHPEHPLSSTLRDVAAQLSQLGTSA